MTFYPANTILVVVFDLWDNTCEEPYNYVPFCNIWNLFLSHRANKKIFNETQLYMDKKGSKTFLTVSVSECRDYPKIRDYM